MLRIKLPTILVGVAISVLWVAAPAQAEDITVTIDNFAFTPQNVTVKPGTKVTWINHDDIPHSIASGTQGLRSKALDTDQSFSFTFTTPGAFKYFCGLHPHMTGSIVVEGTTGSAVSQ